MTFFGVLRRPSAKTGNVMDKGVVIALVAQERAEQGLPPTISDPAALRRLASLLAGMEVKNGQK